MDRQRSSYSRSVIGCKHSFIRKGYYLGLGSDVYVCMSCQEVREPDRWEDFERRRRPPAGLLNEPTDGE